MDALELRVEPAPARDAVDVDGDLGLRQRPQLVVREGDRPLDLAEDLEVPRRQFCSRDAAGVEDRPLVGQVLTRRQARGIEALLDELLLGLGTEERHAYLH